MDRMGSKLGSRSGSSQPLGWECQIQIQRTIHDPSALSKDCETFQIRQNLTYQQEKLEWWLKRDL